MVVRDERGSAAFREVRVGGCEGIHSWAERILSVRVAHTRFVLSRNPSPPFPHLPHPHIHPPRRDELTEQWRIFTPVLQGMDRGSVPLETYAYGSRGPKSGALLLLSAVVGAVVGGVVGGVEVRCALTGRGGPSQVRAMVPMGWGVVWWCVGGRFDGLCWPVLCWGVLWCGVLGCAVLL